MEGKRREVGGCRSAIRRLRGWMEGRREVGGLQNLYKIPDTNGEFEETPLVSLFVSNKNCSFFDTLFGTLLRGFVL